MNGVRELLRELLDDPSVTDLCINGARGAFVDRDGALARVEIAGLNEESLKGWVLGLMSEAGVAWDARHPFVDATLKSGHRLHAAFPPLAGDGVLVSLRRLGSHSPTRAARWRADPAFGLLAAAVARGDSVLISGATGSGKTTLANELLACVPACERVIALEDTAELAPRHPHFLSLLSRPPNADGFGEVTLRQLLRQTLRMRPDRVVLGECRGAEVLDLLQLLNTGHRGAMATIHAHSPRDALRRIELLCLLAAGGTIPVPTLRELMAVGLKYLVQVERVDGARRISEIKEVAGREGETILLRPVS